MPARTGRDYLQRLAGMKPSIFLNGRQVVDVCGEPAFQGALQSVSELYDLQHDPRFREFMLYPSPTAGDSVHVGFQPASSRAVLVAKRKAFKLRTDYTFGFMGRTMDFMNQMVTNMY